MFSLLAPSLSSLNPFSALIVQPGLAVQYDLVFYMAFLFKMALIAQNRQMEK